VALKTIRSENGLSAAAQLRFKEEFRSMARLRHPNTVTVYDFGIVDAHTRYLTMELVDGTALSELCRHPPLPLAQVRHYLLQLLQALGFIHSRLFVHRDIKADNIHIRPDGILKLMDFGLMDQLGMVSQGQITGTPGYLPPEVLQGGVIAAPADLYSVGCLAYELLTGRLPFAGDLVTVIRAHLDTTPPPPSAWRPEIPPALDAIVMRLLAKDPDQRYAQAAEVILELAAEAGMPMAAESLEQKKSYLTSSVLVAREEEVAELHQALQETLAGHGRAIFVGAPAGIGKTHLMHEVLLQGKLADIPVFQGQCLEAGMSAYEPLVQALRPLLAQATPAEVQPVRQALGRLFPELRAPEPHAPALQSGEDEKIRLHDAIVTLLQGVSRRTPLIVFLDDLHWCDRSSLEAFNTCITRLRESRVLFLGTFRNDETPASSPVWFTLNEGLTRYLPLAAFTQGQVCVLLRALLHTPAINDEFSAGLYSATGGNAFFVAEVLRFLMEEGILVHQGGVWHFPTALGDLQLPDSVEATVLRRLRQLSPDAHTLAQVAAVLGRSPDLDILRVVSGFDDEQLFAALDELIARQFLIRDAHRYTFPHARVQEALYGAIPPETRQAWHHACGDYLERLAPETQDAQLNELAFHFSRGHDAAKAFHYLNEAGYRAFGDGIIADALDHWQAAEQRLSQLDLPNQDEAQAMILYEIVRASYQLWPAVAIRATEKLIPLLLSQADPRRVAPILQAVVNLVVRVAPWLAKLPSPLIRAFESSLSQPLVFHCRPRHGWRRFLPINYLSWMDWLVEAYGFAAAAYGFEGRIREGLAMLAKLEEALPFRGTPYEGGIAITGNVIYMAAGHFDTVRVRAQQALQFLAGKNLLNQRLLYICYESTHGYLITRGCQGYRPDPWDLSESIRLCEQIRAYHEKNLSLAYYTLYFAWSGRHREAMELIEQIEANRHRYGGPPYPWSLYLRAHLAWQRGEFAEGLALARQALSYTHTKRDAVTELTLLNVLALLQVAVGQHEDAQATLSGIVARSRQHGLDFALIQGLLGQAQVAMATAAWDTAAGCLLEVIQLAGAGPARNPLHEAIALRLQGDVAMAHGDLGTAQVHFQRALAIVSEPAIDNLFEQGLLCRGLAEWHLQRSEREAAFAALERAQDLFRAQENRHQLRLIAQRLETLRARQPQDHAESIARTEDSPDCPPTLWDQAFPLNPGI